MKLPDKYMYETCNLELVPDDERKFQTLRGFREWVQQNNPKDIEMSELQFWQFTYLQPLHAGEERYWNTFCGIPIRCPEMTVDQRMRLRLWDYYESDEQKNARLTEEAEVYDNPPGS